MVKPDGTLCARLVGDGRAGEQGIAEERKAGGLQQVRKLLLCAQKSARWIGLAKVVRFIRCSPPNFRRYETLLWGIGFPAHTHVEGWSFRVFRVFWCSASCNTVLHEDAQSERILLFPRLENLTFMPAEIQH